MKTNKPTDVSVLGRAKSAAYLDQRIDAYANRQTLDLNEWVFDEVMAPAGGTVLELCSGTGVQTLYLAKQVGPGGRVMAVDASEAALTKAVARCLEAGGEVVPLCGDLDSLSVILNQAGIKPGGIDLCFCSYGLYYAQETEQLLDVICEYLSPRGELVVVGPYGRNNQELYGLLVAAGVSIPEYVMYTSRDFMPMTLLPSLADDFSRMVVRMTRNKVSWITSREVLTYWRNTTFFDAGREAAVSKLLDAHFEAHGVFVNHKNIMCVTASQPSKNSGKR